MTVLNASSATLAAFDRIVTVLRAELPAVLAALPEVDDYRLLAPEAYITAPADVAQAFRTLNVDEVACWVLTEGPSQYGDWDTGDTTQASGIQTTRIMVTIVARDPDGVKLPTIHGRELLLSEWSRRRAELFKGAVLDVITEHLYDGVNVHQVFPVANDAAPVVIDGFSHTSQAAVVFELTQDILIRRNDN